MIDVLTSVPTVLATAVLAILLLLGDLVQREVSSSRSSGMARTGGVVCTVAFLVLVLLRFVNLGA